MEKKGTSWFSEKVCLTVALDLISLADAEKYEPLYKSQRIYSSKQIDDFVIEFKESAHIKDSKDFTYKLANKHMLNVFGCDEKELLGNSVTSFFGQKIMEGRWIDDYARKIHEYDLEVIKSKLPIKYIPDPILDKNGFVFAHSGLKIPLFGDNNEIGSIVTLTFNITNTLKIRAIRQAYAELYGGIDGKNEKFGEQIGIPSLGFLTEREIDCLLSAVRYRSGKLIAKDLNISAKTVDMHLGRVREKLNCNFTDDLINNFLTSIEKKGFFSI